MRRTLLTLLAGSALLLAGCTSDTIQPDRAEPRDFPSPSSAAAEGTGVVDVVDQVLPAVVNVVVDTDQGRGEGSGFVIREDGIIVTNYHVVERASSITVLTSDTEPIEYEARVIGADIPADLAILDVDAEGLATVPMGRSGDLELGQPVVAIGYALGLEGGPSVTSGIVSSLTRQIEVQDPGCPQEECGTDQTRVYSDVIQTDAAINPGNSGGPLVDLAGNVVGINSAGTTTAENVGFAIQIDSVRATILHAVENPDEPVAYMGILNPLPVSDPQVQFQFDPRVDQGVLIQDVVPDGPAEQAGIQPGDVVIAFAGEAIESNDDLLAAIRSHQPGDRVEVGIVRGDGERDVVTVELGVNPIPNG
ncbi:MAG: S1C family serine protease [Actinomycetota bacterium]